MTEVVMTENEELALAIHMMTGLQKMPTEPWEWEKCIEKILRTMTKERLANELKMTIERLDELLDRPLVDEYDDYNRRVEQCVNANRNHFSRVEVLALLQIGVLRVEKKDIVVYIPLRATNSYHNAVAKSDDGKYRAELALKGVTYYTYVP